MIAAVQASRHHPAHTSLSGRAADALVEVIIFAGAMFNAVVGVISLVMPSVFLAIVGQPTTDMGPAIVAFGAYAGARELAVALALVGLRVARSQGLLSGVLVVAALSNAIDACGAVVAERWVQLPGAVMFTVAYAFAATWVAKRATSARGA